MPSGFLRNMASADEFMLKVSTGGAGRAETVMARPEVGGKFLWAGREKLYVRGVTYGPFRPTAQGEYGSEAKVHQDFRQMVARGINAVRTYTVPPRWLLDRAEMNGLRVLVGTAWEQHVAFLEDRGRARDIEKRVRAGVSSCAGHPAVLGYAIGNEIPASLVRWYGRRRTERFIERLYWAAKEVDPEGLVTYVNYPTTEYLELPFLDFVAFNVYLETEERLSAYLARLHNLAGDRPLVVAELGIDGQTHGALGQARALSWQISTSFATGSAGTFVFSWTDEWYRGGEEVSGWEFGLTDRERRAKPGLTAVERRFARVPFDHRGDWPRISVIICSYNGAATLRECLGAVEGLEYPNYETIVVDDGSTDGTAEIASQYDVRLIRSTSQGLSAARNLGLAAATGSIVAYLDDDAYPDPHWLTYLAADFTSTAYAGIGGPNIAPRGAGLVEECVSNAPGGPIHVLYSDREAEHIPGCNMAFRRECLEEVGGFDPRFRAAGDDVDLCWRLQERGWTLGFSPAAMVWHHRRSSVAGYWRQQLGYGRAEALLERKWPGKYNALGHVAWKGRLYGDHGSGRSLFRRGRIYQGTWGSALFQSVYTQRPGLIGLLPTMPEWYLVISGLGVLWFLGMNWSPIEAIASLAAPACAILITQAGIRAARSRFPDRGARNRPGLRRWLLTTVLYVLQPLARLLGRLGAGLTPWRLRGGKNRRLTWRSVVSLWSDHWRSPQAWLRDIETRLRQRGIAVRRGGDFDSWDLEVRAGGLSAVRVRVGIEEHAQGKQLLRVRWSLTPSPTLGLIAVAMGLAVAAAADGAWSVTAVLGAIAGFLSLRNLQEFGISASALLDAVEGLKEPAAKSRPGPRVAEHLELNAARVRREESDRSSGISPDLPAGPPSGPAEGVAMAARTAAGAGAGQRVHREVIVDGR